jgi:hypothetical protein
VRVVSSPDNAGTGQHYRMVRVRQARREGVREKPVFNAPQVSRQLEPGGSGLDSGAHPPCVGVGNSGVGSKSSIPEATVSVCGVAAAMPQGYSWAPHPRIGS